MHIAVYLKHRADREWSRAQYVRRIDMRARRPVIVTQADPAPVAADVSLDALSAILGEHVACSAHLSAYRIETSDRFAYVEGFS